MNYLFCFQCRRVMVLYLGSAHWHDTREGSVGVDATANGSGRVEAQRREGAHTARSTVC